MIDILVLINCENEIKRLNEYDLIGYVVLLL